jgi:hypothetical protein
MRELEVGTTFAGHRIDAVLGRGGMGVVYRATHLALDRPVALKVMSAALLDDPGFRTRFRRESRIAASLDHPHIVPVHHAGDEDGVMYISMRLIDGDDLAQVLRDEGRFEPRRAADLTGQIASALDTAHEHGLVHRDVKPANVLCTTRDGREHVYLTDFGLTKSTRSTASLTETGGWVGTLDYIAPEQIRGDGVDARADVYSLGCVLYQQLAGQVPFPTDSYAAKVWAHLNDTPPPLAEAAPGITTRMQDVVSRAMAKEPDERYPSAGEFAADVAGALDQEQPTRARQRPPEPRRPTVETQPAATVPAAQPKMSDAAVKRRRWAVRFGLLLVLVAAATAGSALAPDDGGDPVDRDEAIALLERFQANLTNERLDGVERLLAPGFTRGTLADPPVGRAEALEDYRAIFASRRQPRVSFDDVRVDTKPGRATIRAQFLRTTPGRLHLGDSGGIVLTMVESDGGLLVESVRNYPHLVVAPPRLRPGHLPATIAVEASATVAGRRIPVAAGRRSLRTRAEAVIFPLTAEARRRLRTEQPIDVRITTAVRGGAAPITDRYTTAFAG